MFPPSAQTVANQDQVAAYHSVLEQRRQATLGQFVWVQGQQPQVVLVLHALLSVVVQAAGVGQLLLAQVVSHGQKRPVA